MARFGYVVLLFGLSACFVSPAPNVSWLALALYALHAGVGIVRAFHMKRWLSVLSLASFYVYFGAIIPMLILSSLERPELTAWSISCVAAIAVHTACSVIAWVKGIYIARWFPDKAEFSGYLSFRWLRSVEA